MQQEWSALGTSVVLRVTEPITAPAARLLVEQELAEIDLACSRFRTDSELSRVNAAAGRFVRVSELFAEAVDVALRAARLTDGDVDPALGEALVFAGYDRDWELIERSGYTCERPPGVRSIRAHLRRGWRAIELDRDRGLIRIPLGVQLDLGATAKAWAADRCASAVHEATAGGVLVALGGDIATAGTAPPAGWRVHVTDDHRASPHAPGQAISIRGGGLATSSTTVRRWKQAGTTMHHIIDPRTGLPVQGALRTVSTAAANCADANIASTAALVRGADASAWLERLGLPARLVSTDGHVRHIAGWPAEVRRERAAA